MTKRIHMAMPIKTEEKARTERIVSNFMTFSPADLSEMAEAIREERYFFELHVNDTRVQPMGAFDFLFGNEFYHHSLADTAAYWEYILLCYVNERGEEIKTPVSIYGVSPARRVRTALITLHTLSQLVKVNEKDAYLMIAFRNDEEFQEAWKFFNAMKFSLMHRLFEFYFGLGGGYVSSLDWRVRHKGNLTREAAEIIPDIVRYEDTETQIEYYYNAPADGSIEDYLRDTFARKSWLYNQYDVGIVTKTPFESYPPAIFRSVQEFYRCLILPNGEAAPAQKPNEL